MDYPFENLDPEKFQHFCQALLAKDHPGMQCFPVAQPDGGRDATQTFFDVGRGKEFAMFQVKFVRNPLKENDPHKWLAEILAEEAPKVKKQIRAGAKFFTLMTNVPGTAHPDSGSIDKVNGLLTAELGIPSVCLWRNDLSRRLDSAWDLKWAYPELMTGPDLIRLVIEGNLTDSRERRVLAIRAFVTNQYVMDQYVKFKQVDLDNRLLDLFIDVPIGPGYGSRWQPSRQRRYFPNNLSADSWVHGYEAEIDDELVVADARTSYLRRGRNRAMGAAAFALSQLAADEYPYTVIEGAPGQGKSTITQYICQVHRMRLLDKHDELSQIPPIHRSGPMRLPVKVDLRDFAVWLARRNPFTAEAEEIPIPLWEKSLEGFIAALIRNQSGGAQFDVSDLLAVSKLSAVLLIMDGLDEVADIKRRAEVVAEIVKGSERLQSVAASLQVIVTSRPAAFENSPGLPEQTFRYLSLDSVTQDLIDEYANKWLKARRLDERESADVRRILKEKLSQPHLRDLARNPMQLAILLSLIHTRGVSLPDKRTALYDSYIELFFNRESEKSGIVRDNRDLLIDIHRYLAWLLHVEAEQSDGARYGRPSGAIEAKRLKSVLRSYLASEGRDPDLADDLFTGLIERVVALVSRVQGTYEFEVQPLREYFAARFLHETAPYSPVGDEKRGTRPDRFDAIARNFYWLNVTRFYAGCYSKGELASLIDRLSELIRDPEFQHLSHPRILGATLLGDWVFTQHPKSVSEVIRLVLDGLGLRYLLTSTSRRLSHSQPLVLPGACGKSELIEKCLSMLRQKLPADYALDVLDLLHANTSRDEVLPLWKTEATAVTGLQRTAWLKYGLDLGCLPVLNLVDLQPLFADEPLTSARIDVLIKSRRADYFEATDENREAILNAVLDRRVSIRQGLRNPCLLETFAEAIDAVRYAVVFREPSQMSLAEILKRYSPRGSFPLPTDAFDGVDWKGANECKQVIAAAVEADSIEGVRWATELAPWDKLISIVSREFGERWAVRQLANIASGIKASSETCTDCPDLFDSAKSLCRRARYARLRAGTPTWWNKQFKEASTAEQSIFCCQLYFTWASPNCVSQTIADADRIVSALSDSEWPILFDAVEQAIDITRPQSSERGVEFLEGDTRFTSCSLRTLALLRLRARPATALRLYETFLATVKKTDERVLRVFQLDAIGRLVIHTKDIEKHLDVLAKAYKCGALSPAYAPQQYARQELLHEIPVKLAKEIVERADRYPSFLVAAAEGRCRIEAAKHVRPVGKVAEEEGWF